MMDSRKVFGRYFLFLCVVVFIIVFIFGILSVTEKVRQFSTAQPEVTVNTEISSTLNVSVKVISTECEDAEKIDYSLVELSISGGKPPYELTILNSESLLFGPYTIMNNNFPIRMKVYGGDHFTSIVHSSADEIWYGTIGLPSEAEICKINLTSTFDSIFTETPTEFPVPINTEIIIPKQTFTSTVNSSLSPIATNTKKPGSQKTNTPISLQITPTAYPLSSVTPGTHPTDTPLPRLTSTPRPQPTATSPPPSTLVPTPINPHPKQCEDGIDNDDDGKTDYPADPDCKRPSDPKE